MAGLREIQERIKSIQDTRKITGAMYMIASTKMKKAKRDLDRTEPYFYTLQTMVERVSRHLPDTEHRYFASADYKAKKIGILVVTGDKGLAGAYNHNIMKMVQGYMDNPELDVKLYVVGEMGRAYFSARHIPIAENFCYTAQNPTFDRARWITGYLLEPYMRGEFDEIRAIYTRMESSMSDIAMDQRILPLVRPDLPEVPIDTYREDFFSLTSPEETMQSIGPNYIAGFIYGALVEAFCSEQNDRMMAMEAATNNADELLHDLNIMYNRARQAAITQEITEVSSGARAQRKRREDAKKKAEKHQKYA